MERKEEKHSLSDWKIILSFLKTVKHEELAQNTIRTIVDLISLQELPDLMHSLWFHDYLFHSESDCRRNSSWLLQEACIRFDTQLLPLLTFSRSDGSLMRFDEVDVSALLKQKDFLFKAAPVMAPDNGEEDIIYKKSWYEKQRKKLNRLITSSREVYQGMKVCDVEQVPLLEEEDLVSHNNHEDFPNTENRLTSRNNFDEVTSETWFARLFRYLIVNWLHDEWSFRLGAIKSINAILTGLSRKKASLVLIPDYLLEDIISVGITVLIKDHFIDYDSESDHSLLMTITSTTLPQNMSMTLFGFSPVKEGAVEVIMLAVKLLLSIEAEKGKQFQTKLFEDLLILIQSENHWTVRLGSLISVGSFIRHFPELANMNLLNQWLPLLLSSFYESETFSRELLYLIVFHLQLIVTLQVKDIESIDTDSMRLISEIIGVIVSTINRIVSWMTFKSSTDTLLWKELDPILPELIIYCLLLLLRLLWQFLSIDLDRFQHLLTHNLFELSTHVLGVINHYHVETDPSQKIFPIYHTGIFLQLELLFSYMSSESVNSQSPAKELKRKELLIVLFNLFYFTSYEYSQSIDQLEGKLANLTLEDDTHTLPDYQMILDQSRSWFVAFHFARLRYEQTVRIFWKTLTLLLGSVYGFSIDQSEDCLLRLFCQIPFDDADIPSINSSMVVNDQAWKQLQTIQILHREKYNYLLESVIFTVIISLSPFPLLQERGIRYLRRKSHHSQAQIKLSKPVSKMSDLGAKNSIPLKRPRFQIKIATEEKSTSQIPSRDGKGKDSITDDGSIIEFIALISTLAYCSLREEEFLQLIQHFRNRVLTYRFCPSVLPLLEAVEQSQRIVADKEKILLFILDVEKFSLLSRLIPTSSIFLLVAHILNRSGRDGASEEGDLANLMAYIYESITSKKQRKFYDRVLMNLLALVIDPSGDHIQGFATLQQWLLNLKIGFSRHYIRRETFCYLSVRIIEILMAQHISTMSTWTKEKRKLSFIDFISEWKEVLKSVLTIRDKNDKLYTDNPSLLILFIRRYGEFLDFIDPMTTEVPFLLPNKDGDNNTLLLLDLRVISLIGHHLHDQIYLQNETLDEEMIVSYARLYHSLIFPFSSEIAICDYDVWLSIGVKGFGHYYSVVRSECVQGFRGLVPMAPIGLHYLSKASYHSNVGSTRPSTAIPMVQYLLAREKTSKIIDSSDHIDQAIIQILFHCSHLNVYPLRDYQWEGISWWTFLRRCGLSGILTDEMGLGKTIQALCCAAITRIEYWLRQEEGLNYTDVITAFSRCRKDFSPILIIAPAAVTLHWKNEIDKFFPSFPIPSEKRSLFQPVICDRQYFQRKDCSFRTADVMIVSYDMLRNQSIYFQSINWELIILDEAHLIRNPSTKMTQTIISLQSSYRFPLTGTPLQNHLEDLWSLMQFLLPDYLGSYPNFQMQYLKPIQKSIKLVKLLTTTTTSSSIPDFSSTDMKSSFCTSTTNLLAWKGIDLLHQLHKQILPFILRRQKSDVLQDLPPKTIVNLICPLSNIQQQMYEKAILHFQQSHSTVKKEKDLDGQFIDETLVSVATTTSSMNSLPVQETTNISETNHILYDQFVKESSTIKSIQNHRSNQFQFSLHDSRPSIPAATTIHPFQLLSYLQSLCFHPVLVIPENRYPSYYQSVVRKITASGKFVRLFKLLMDTQIVSREDFISNEDSVSDCDLDATSFETFSASINREVEKFELMQEDEEEVVEGRDESDNTIEYDENFKDDASSCSASSSENGNITTANNSRSKLSTPTEISRSKKCLIFCKYQQSLELLDTSFFQRYFPHLSYRRLDGSMTPQQRFMIAQQFNQSSVITATPESEPSLREKDHMPAFPSCFVDTAKNQTIDKNDIRILLMTTRSCGLGLNLSAADTVIFLEHDWNPFVDLQAMDRVHRLGQKHPVSVYRLLADAAIERRIQTYQDLKTDIAEEVISGKSFPFQSQSTSEPTSSTTSAATVRDRDDLGLQLWESLAAKKN